MKNRKITSIDDLSAKDIHSIAELAIKFKKSKKRIAGNNTKNIFNLFLEPSTRTTISCELAAKNLGYNSVNINFEKSSLSKRETFNDTMDTLMTMKPDALVIRDKNNLSPMNIAKKSNVPVINAGDGTNEHPTQALLDYCVIKEIFKKKKIKIGICGDIKHSRVAHSNIKLLSKMGYQIHIIAPTYFLNKNEQDELIIIGHSMASDIIFRVANTNDKFICFFKLFRYDRIGKSHGIWKYLLILFNSTYYICIRYIFIIF